jgi:hypothetical protein
VSDISKIHWVKPRRDSLPRVEVGAGHGKKAEVLRSGRATLPLSAAGDPLERLAEVVDFELLLDDLEAALARSAKGGRPP